jgi:PTS system nitrogen regulatory IIA component
MITVADGLRPEHVALEVRERSAVDAISVVAALLRNDERVLDWEPLFEGLHQAAPCLPATPEFAICIPHVRTDQVTSLVMSVGRSREGIVFPGSPAPARYIFCIGVQLALAADYLRIVGLLVRAVKDPGSEAKLRSAANGLEFVETLSHFEARL